MVTHCENCGSRMRGGFCTWCDEEVFIMEQYIEQDMELPDPHTEFMKRYRQSVEEKADKEKTCGPR